MKTLTTAVVITLAILALPSVIVKIALVATATAILAIAFAKLYAD